MEFYPREILVLWEVLACLNFLEGFSLGDQDGKCVWTICSSVQFSVHSMYSTLKARQVASPFKDIWFLKTPSKSQGIYVALF